MIQKEIKTRKIPGLKQTVKKEIVGNAIVMIIIVLCSWGLTFGLWGPATDDGTFIGYMACMIPFFTLIQSYVPCILKRTELNHGKWELKSDEKDLPNRPVVNTWSLLLPRALAYGFGVMLALVALVKVTNWQPTTTGVVLIVLAANITTTTLLIRKYLPIDMLSFAKSIDKDPLKPPQPMGGYLIVEHAVPFILLQGFINACVANRAFHFEAAKAGVDYVPTPALLPDTFICFVLLALIQWMFSNWLSRGDVRLGRVPAGRLKKISWWGALGLILLAATGISVLYGGILAAGGVPGLDIAMATLFRVVVVALSIVFGSWIGIHWGASRELAKMAH